MIIFQGDSITDAGRSVDGIGCGYVKMVADTLKLTLGKDFINSGIGGDRSCDVLLRLYKDTLKYRPQIVTLLVGVNDVWREFDSGKHTAAAEYAYNMSAILKNIKDCGSKIILMQPFILSCGVVSEMWSESYNSKVKCLEQVAEDYSDSYIRLGEIFAELSKGQAPEVFATDGVHPSQVGCEVICEYLVKEIKKYI